MPVQRETRGAASSAVQVTALCIAAAMPGTLLADTSVWKVSKADDHVFVGGTVHMLSKAEFPLPAAFERSYEQADSVVFETDIAALQSEATQTQLIESLLYPAGTTLADKVSPDTLARFKAFLDERGLPVEQFLSFKPGMIMAGLTGLELQRLGIDGEGVDAFFDRKAAADDVPRESLESIDDQVGFLSRIGETNADAIVRGLIDEMENLGPQMDATVAAWRAGDTAMLNEQIVEPMKSDYPLMYDTLLAERNARWLPKIEALFEQDGIELVLVGAGHLAGKEGLLESLANAGYRVEQYLAP